MMVMMIDDDADGVDVDVDGNVDVNDVFSSALVKHSLLPSWLPWHVIE